MSQPVWIKFCGMTRAQDVDAAVALGIDAIGLVFTRRSRRCLSLNAASHLRSRIPAGVATVALFMDDEPTLIREVISVVAPDLLQFHGTESSDYCASFGTRHLKAIPMGSVTDVERFAAAYPTVEAFLLDSHTQDQPGGSGEQFDWRRFPAAPARPLILAGGLDSSNVAVAIQQARPWGVDVSSGIESAPGIKDKSKMQQFLNEARRAGQSANA